MATGDLPVGFTLDEPAPAAALPAGFDLDEPAAQKRTSTLPANAGLSKLLTSVAGLPVDTIENVLNLGRAGFGTAVTAAGKPHWAPDLVKGSVGGSQWLQERARATGMPGLSPDNPTPDSAVGTAQYDFVARGGVLPGGAIPAAGSMIAEKLGGPEWAGVGAMAPSGATASYNAARAPSMARDQARNAVRDTTLREAQEAGYVLPPSQVNPSFVGNRLESVAGKAALNQDSVLRNQQVTNNIARRETGLPENAPITQPALEARRHVLAAPYREVSGLSPVAASALQRLRDVRSEAQAYWRHYDVSATPDSQRQARQLDQQAVTLERVIEQQATRANRPELAGQLRQARRDIARTYDVERALNLGDGNVDARILGRALDRGRPLTGGLQTAARFSEAFPQLTRAAGGNPTPGVSALESLGVAGFGLGGAAAMGPGGLALGALPLARQPTRATLLSDIYQRNFARPNYQPGMQPENSIQSLARIAAMENERARK